MQAASISAYLLLLKSMNSIVKKQLHATMSLIYFLHAVLSDAADETVKPAIVRHASTTECIASIRDG